MEFHREALGLTIRVEASSKNCPPIPRGLPQKIITAEVSVQACFHCFQEERDLLGEGTRIEHRLSLNYERTDASPDLFPKPSDPRPWKDEPSLWEL